MKTVYLTATALCMAVPVMAADYNTDREPYTEVAPGI